MKDLAAEVKSLGIKPEQVQDFTPTPMTLSTLIYYTGFDPYSGKKVYVARNPAEKKKQKEYFFWYKSGDRKPATGNRRTELKIGKENSRGGIKNRKTGTQRRRFF
jgi:radical SAM superfamily enzyme YgiQ (UPF0313 family)